VAIVPRLELRQGQSLVMTPQLQQAIKLLQLSNLELLEYVETELERNPLLEHDERADAPDPRETAQDEREPAGISLNEVNEPNDLFTFPDMCRYSPEETLEVPGPSD